MVSPKRYRHRLDRSHRAHFTVNGSERLGSNWKTDPRLTLATNTSGSSLAGASASMSSAVQSVSVPLIRTFRCGSTAVAMACNGCTDAGVHNEIQAPSAWAGELCTTRRSGDVSAST